jgi:hypothetical protein
MQSQFEAMPEFAPEFQEIGQDIRANLDSVVSEVEGHDLHQSEELLLDATKQSLKLLLDRLEAKGSVDMSPELLTSLEAVSKAQSVYDENTALLASDNEVQIDAATMIQCTDAFKDALAVAHKLMQQHIEDQQKQLDQNLDCNHEEKLPCLAELEAAKQQAAKQRSVVEKVRRSLASAKEKLKEEESARQGLLKMNADSFSKAREGIERKQADVKEQMQKLAGTYLDLEANRKLIVEAENFISAEQGRCTTEFQDGDRYCNETKDKLAAKLADLMALDEAVKAELKLVSDVQTRAKQVVVDYSTKLKLTKAQNAFETKQLFDNQYKLLLKAKYNGTEKEQHLKAKLATLERKRKLAVKRGDEDAEQELMETMTSLKEKIQSADANMAASCSRLNELDQEWESFFVPLKLAAENEQFADLRLHDEREALEVDVRVLLMDEDESDILEEKKEIEAREKKRRADADMLDKKVKEIEERRKMITQSGDPAPGA